MVDAVVSFVVERLGDLLIEQVVLLQEVKDDVEWLRDKLKYLLCFLKDAEEKQDVDNRMRQWLSDMRDVAHEAEDIIDDFIVPKVVAESEATTQKYWLDIFGNPFKKAKLNQEANLGIGGKIKTLKMKLDQIQKNQVDFQIRRIDDAREGSDRMNMMDWLRKERPYKDNEHVVGFKEDANKLMSELVRDVKDRYVISIMGTGGLGKTTLARKLYNTLTPEEKFDRYSWVSVSKDYKIQDLLLSAIKSFKRQTTKEEIEFLEKMKEDDLESYLRDYLEGHRYLVVLDDVWDVNVWPSLMRAFPNENNGSRVILTTRIKAVTESRDERTYAYELPFLKDEESWELFCSKAFPNYDDEVGNKKNCCPPHLESLAREMVSKCRGLPLAIVVLGGLLRRKDEHKWRRLKEHMWRYVRDHDSNRVQYILALSFNDLPFHLKSCFLYMGLFPEDFEIVVEKLCRLWEAEGFIKLNGESFEEAAEECLRELIDRSLIQVAERNWKRILTCRVHDLLRDFAIQKSKELNFLHIYEDILAPNIRRLVSYSYCAFQRVFSLDHSDMRLRTLSFFGGEDTSMEIAQLLSLCRELRLLRVLNVECHSPFSSRETEERLPNEIGKLIHLRYLGFPGANTIVPSQFIGNLHFLQTLELPEIGLPIQLPDEVCKAKQLRHLIGRFKWPFLVDNLQNLRTLRTVLVEDPTEFNPMGLINLRELHVDYVGEGNIGPITLDSIGGLRSLQSLWVGVSAQRRGNREVHLHPLSHCQHLVQLRLLALTPRIIWKLWTEVLPNLKYLSVVRGSFTEDPMPMLEKLPKLTILVINDCCLPELVCSSAGGFPQLQILQIRGKCLLKKFQVEEGGMPVLEAFAVGTHVSIPARLQTIRQRLLSPIDRHKWAY